MKPYTLLFAPLAALVACNSHETIVETTSSESSNDLSAIVQMEGLQDQTQHFRVDALRQDTLLLPNGGSIIFKDHAFVDEKGNPVSGEVDVAWQEFHSLADIALSGIPMKYDSAGVKYDLVSGGMFSIHASQNNKPVELAPGKTAEVNLVSLQDTPCYNFYELDEKSGQWDYQTTAAGERVEEAPEEAQEEVKKHDHILNMSVDVRSMPELNPDEITGWIPVDKLTSEERDWLKSRMIATKMLSSNLDGTYNVEIKSGQKRQQFRLKPYTLAEARRDTRSNEHALNREVDEILAYQQNVAAGKIVRTIEIENFGTYNWDIAMKRKNGVVLAAEFEFPEKVQKKLVHLFLISPDENAIVRYDATGSDMFSYDPALRNCLIALMPDNSLMVVDNNSFKKSRKTGGDKNAKAVYTFENTGVKVRNPSDIQVHLPKFI
jgi:hypothetical protein